MANKVVRCAIYTRKSSEEGLEQAFNSLEAQREACCAYILSQKHEGWTALNTQYDDGGFSGGTMDRPALKQLLDDIQAGKVDTVVVYKVDRLTRALNDFSKIIEVFDSHGVSFVSVTQQFNTTTSMGRLTLNVLLSFAQFEREVTGERIRDKVAASKKKGMWMGGSIPCGYDCVDHRLIVNQTEANTVREIFRQYMRLGCVTKLKNHLDHEGMRSRVRISKTGRTSGGTNYSRGALYHVLNNRIYLGEIVHRGQTYPGEHEAIVPRELWDKAAAKLKVNNQGRRSRKSQSTSSLLTGRIFDINGIRFTPTHAVKKGKRYRYYTSQVSIQNTGEVPETTRFPAHNIEEIVVSQVHVLLQSPDKFTVALDGRPEKDVVAERVKKLAKGWAELEISKKHQFIRAVLQKVVVGQTKVWTEFNGRNLVEAMLGRKPDPSFADGQNMPKTIKLTADFRPARRGGELRLVAPKNSFSEGTPAPAMVKAIARARDWYEQIIAGEIGTLPELARRTRLPSRYVKRILKCALLSPQITETILSGRQRADMTLQTLLDNIPIDWRMQENSIAHSL